MKAILGAALVLCACAPSVSLRVSSSAVAELPLERKLTLLDAENGLLAAVDARDAQEDRALAAADARRDAARRVRDAEQARDKEKGSADIARAAVAEAEARKTFADRDRDLQRARVALSDAELMVADAKFEEARAAEVEAAALPGAQGVHEKDFSKQVAKLEKVRDRKAQEVKEAQAATDAARAAWTEARGGLAKLTYGAQGSVWVN
jgi:colicin import membrane protein